MLPPLEPAPSHASEAAAADHAASISVVAETPLALARRQVRERQQAQQWRRLAEKLELATAEEARQFAADSNYTQQNIDQLLAAED